MTLRVYVAGASSEIDDVERYVAQLRAMGIEISHDWCADIRKAGTANAGLSTAERDMYARRDLAGVSDADVFWLMVPRTGSIGCWVELGFALANRRLVIVSGDDGRSIFAACADVMCESHEGALLFLKMSEQNVEKLVEENARLRAELEAGHG